MADWRQTRLWQETLAERSDDPHSDPRGHLRHAYEQFRGRAEQLATDIALGLPGFTVHDITHLDALWEMADLVLADQESLTPTEAFVFGSAILAHDLGMGLAAYPGGLDELKGTPLWTSAVHAQMYRRLGRAPTHTELSNPPPEVVDAVRIELLRENHARQASKLPLVSWGHDPAYFLIDDVDMRVTYGNLIGQLASSHWLATSELPERFTTVLGSAATFPKAWTVDPLRLACLLRAADAAHLDARRAPGFLRALRDIKGIAERHWRFQEHLSQPRREDDRLVYTTPRPFALEEASAWWLCFDTLSALDTELRQIDALLADEGRARFAAKAVAKVEAPDRLIDLIPTDGWLPIDAQPKISDVVGLIERLGGEELYGDSPLVPLRELVENAADAVRARRALVASHRPRVGAASYIGAIWVSVKADSEGWELQVADNGVGMDVGVMTGALLDFGESYWASRDMTADLPEIAGSSFQPTGKYGIGFYSVFMLGREVSVVSRRFDASVGDTHILDFKEGLRSRPILRRALNGEQMPDGGSLVRVKLGGRLVNHLDDLLRAQRLDGNWTLNELCQWLFPALDVDLYTAERDEDFKISVSADDWLRLPPGDLLRRATLDEYPFTLPEAEANLQLTSQLIAPVTDDTGATVARMAIAPGFRHPRFHYMDTLNATAVTLGGARSDMYAPHLAGVLLGKSLRVARDAAIPIAALDAVARWASDQAIRLPAFCTDEAHQAHVAKTVIACNGDPGVLKVGHTATAWVTMRELVDWAAAKSEFLILSTSELEAHRRESGEFKLGDGVIVLELFGGGVLEHSSSRFLGDWPLPIEPNHRRYYRYLGPTSLPGAFLVAVAEAWSTEWRPLLDLLNDELREGTIHLVGSAESGEVSLPSTRIHQAV